ncbi:MAG TPA: NAD(P)-binding domain-containing protein [Gemmatimonadaceae bacterium]|nr:NAD(P)-binding domain-containing protein [Gemmatimonadaceae bacterium]
MDRPITTFAAPRGRVERFETIVVGAGQAGLAVGYHLARRDADFVIVDGATRLGESWRRRWDSLRLFTPAAYSALPGMPFPAHPAHLPDKDEVADYLERYVERFDLPVRTGTRIDSLGWDGERYLLRAGERWLEADNVVVACGPFQRPRVPDVAARLAPDIRQLHSRDYRSPFVLPDGPVLVVGAGNSGAQIALELARFRQVWLAGRETGRIPRTLLGRDIYRWLWPVMTHLTLDTRMGRRLRERARRGDPLVGIPARDFEHARVARVGRLTEVRDGRPVCDDTVLHPSVVIWCTGYSPDFGWIELPVLDEHGSPRHRRGVAEGAPGLYFVGLRFQHRMTSALIGGVGEDADFIAARISERSTERSEVAEV